MRSRFAHLFAVTVGPATAILGVLAMLPKWAGVAGVLLSLLGVLKKAFASADITKPVASLFALLLVGHALFGCAHVTAVAKACKPAPTDVDTALADLQSDGWQAALESMVIAKGVCVVNAAVQQVVDALRGKAELAMPLVATPSADVVTRGQTWLAAHP